MQTRATKVDPRDDAGDVNFKNRVSGSQRASPAPIGRVRLVLTNCPLLDNQDALVHVASVSLTAAGAAKLVFLNILADPQALTGACLLVEAKVDSPVGYMYYYGYGVPQDRVEASRLFHQAAAQGNENARQAIGLNKVHVPVISKIILPSKFLASFFFGFVFLKSGQSHRNRAKVATGVVALLFILSFVLDLFWYSYIGHLQSSTTFTALYFVRLAMGGPIIHARSAKVVLMASVALFIGFVVYSVVISELRHIPVTIRFFCFSGLFIGMFIPSAIFVWLDTKRTGPELNGKGEAATPVAAK